MYSSYNKESKCVTLTGAAGFEDEFDLEDARGLYNGLKSAIEKLAKDTELEELREENKFLKELMEKRNQLNKPQIDILKDRIIKLEEENIRLYDELNEGYEE